MTKADAITGKALAGATLALAYDRDRDGVHETPVGQWVSSAGAESRELRPGDYELREVAPPTGYRRAGVAVRFSVGPGRITPVTITNAPLPAPVPTTPPPPTTQVVAQARPAPPPRRLAREQPPLARLPETGQPITLLALTGSGLVAGGALLLPAGNRASARARRRARSLGTSPPPAQACR
ncbi:MAG: prealbumin-like fold domain-containing protein [Actinomycetota bacterium]|nr:prealbumin-like fold domain-containing protein [Actinomycetota bacterium]